MVNNSTLEYGFKQNFKSDMWKQDDNQWPIFLIMEAADKNVPLDLNAFVL